MRLLAAFFVLAVLPTAAFACISSTEPSFAWMIEDSTLVVRGQVLSDTVINRAPGEIQHQSAVLVERAYKGTPIQTIQVVWREYSLCSRARLDKDDYALFFLRTSGSDFVLVSDDYGKVAVSRWQDESRPQDPLVAIELDLKQAIRKDSGKQLVANVLLLSSIRRPIDTAELRALLPTNDQVLESATLLALLKLHDYSKLEAAGPLVETVPESRNFYLPDQEALSLRTMIASEIMRVEDRSQLPVLQRFSLSSNVWLRENAAYALRHLSDFSNVRYLIRLVEDSSAEARIQAMRGLQELLRPGVEGYGWVPSAPLNGGAITEQEAITRWRSWWLTEGESKYGK